jgi:gluconate:H+ symporter, GntP family
MPGADDNEGDPDPLDDAAVHESDHVVTPHDAVLLWMAAGAVAGVILLIAIVKLHPFIALILAVLGLGLGAGENTAQILKSFAAGFGDIAANVGVVLALGAMFGALLSDSRGADRIAVALTRAGGTRGAPWAMTGIAMLLGLPVFFETGLVMLMPVIIAVGARLESAQDGAPGVGFLKAGLPAIAGLSVLHGLVPPHPGPLAAVNALGADLGKTLLYGLLIAVPVAVLAGPVFAQWAALRAVPHPAAVVRSCVASQKLPSALATTLTVLFPIVLMVMKAAADIALPAGSRGVFDFLGAPPVALLLGTLLAMLTFGFALGRSRAQVGRIMSESLASIAGILLVIGAGGAFKQTLVDLGLDAVMARAAENWHVAPLLMGWASAVMIRLATGSATVATVTAAGLMAGVSGADASLLALAIGAGSLFFSHVNDAGFWLVKEYFGLSLPDMFKTWSLLETIISVSGLLFVLLVSVLRATT